MFRHVMGCTFDGKDGPEVHWLGSRGLPARLVACMLVTAGMGACGNGSDAPPATSAPAPVEEAETETGESFTLLALVRQESPTDVVPLADGTLVFDKPGGERVELAIGPDGLVTVTGVDWSKGKAAMSIFGPATQVMSLVEFDKSVVTQLEATETTAPGTRRDLTWHALPSFGTAPKLQGKISNAQGPYVYVTATTCTDVFGGPATSYELPLAPNKPGTMFVLDYALPDEQSVGPRGAEYVFKRWLRFDQPAIAADTTRDLDLDTGTVLTPLTLKTKIVIPGGADGPLGGSSTARVEVSSPSLNRGPTLGMQSKIDVAADGASFDVDLEYVKVEDAKPQTTFAIMLQDGSVSELFQYDWPTDGFVADGLPTPPVVVETTRSLTEPFAIEGVSDSAAVVIAFSQASGKKDWYVEVPKGVTSVRLPPIAGALRAAIGKPASGVVVSRDDLDPTTNRFRRVSISRRFKTK